MEYCHKTLADHIQNVESPVVYWEKHQGQPETIKRITGLMRDIITINISITQALVYIHNHGEVHRDLKPSNGMRHL